MAESAVASTSFVVAATIEQSLQSMPSKESDKDKTTEKEDDKAGNHEEETSPEKKKAIALWHAATEKIIAATREERAAQNPAQNQSAEKQVSNLAKPKMSLADLALRIHIHKNRRVRLTVTNRGKEFLRKWHMTKNRYIHPFGRSSPAIDTILGDGDGENEEDEVYDAEKSDSLMKLFIWVVMTGAMIGMAGTIVLAAGEFLLFRVSRGVVAGT